jgi:hypothetical protein
MTVDERMFNALAELREALGDGCDVEKALAQIAPEFGFKQEVLRLRAEREFGSLKAVKDAVALERAISECDALIKSAFKKIRAANGLSVNQEPEPVFATHWEREIGFSVLDESDRLSAARARCDVWREINKALDTAMQNA